MQNASDKDAAFHLPVEDYVPSVLVTSQTSADVIARPSKEWIVSQQSATSFDLAQISCGLRFAPILNCVFADDEKVSFSPARQMKVSHATLPRPLTVREPELSTDTSEGVAGGCSAGIAFVNRRSQCGKLEFVMLLLALQSSKAGADDLARVFVPPASYFGGYKTVQFGRQVDIARRHITGSSPAK
jgi:hypothetical protein